MIVSILILLLGIVTCDEDSDADKSVTNAEVAGTYVATSMTADGQEYIVDDNEFRIVLNDDGSTSGRLFIAEGDEDGNDLDADMTGSYSISGTTINFEQTADTFVRDADWEYSDGTLTSSDFADTTLVR